MDAHRRAVLGFAVVSNDSRHANSMIDTIVAFIAGTSEALVVDRSMELIRMDAHFGTDQLSGRGESRLDDEADLPYDEDVGQDDER